MKQLVVWILISCLPGPVIEIGEARESSSPLLDQVKLIQDHLYRLNFEAAEKVSRELIVKFPQEPEGYAFLATTKWNILLHASSHHSLDAYATPTPFIKERTYKQVVNEFNAFEKSNQSLLDFCRAALERDPGNVKARYFEGYAWENFSTAEFTFRKQDGEGPGIRMGKKAVSIHEDVLSRDPGFEDAKVSLATYEFAKATLPLVIKWVFFLLGKRGSKESALSKIDEVIHKGVYRKQDAIVLKALLLAWKGDPRESIRLFEQLSNKYPENYLIDINIAAIYQEQLKDPKSALSVYQRILGQLERKAKGIFPGEIHYRIGKVHYELKEYSKAVESFQEAIKANVRELETVPLSHSYLGSIHEEQRDLEKAKYHYLKVLEYRGNLLSSQLESARKSIRKIESESK